MSFIVYPFHNIYISSFEEVFIFLDKKTWKSVTEKDIRLEIVEQKIDLKDVIADDICKLVIDEKVIQKEFLESVEQKITLDDDIVGDISEASARKNCIEKEKVLITADQEVISSDRSGSFSTKKLSTVAAISCVKSEANFRKTLIDTSNYRNGLFNFIIEFSRKFPEKKIQCLMEKW